MRERPITGALTDPWFEATFIHAYGAGTSEDPGYYRHVATLAEANGVMFRCPCGIGMLPIIFSGREAPEWAGPRLRGSTGGPPPRWQVAGGALTDLTLSPSISVGEPECWHGFVRNGMVT